MVKRYWHNTQKKQRSGLIDERRMGYNRESLPIAQAEHVEVALSHVHVRPHSAADFALAHT